jgi:hypothetical protein
MSKRMDFLFKRFLFIACTYKLSSIGILVIVLILKGVYTYIKQTIINNPFNVNEFYSLHLLFKQNNSAYVWEVITYIAG